ncbi:DASH family cryptochrome [Mangrovimicrobium sediminis]|uniref:Cryptochrome DASH n=1 Tax=Mangrovimicrobium sediminis TaxID=2562682 RepID=A0A4Z0LY19_9GAMM|nr:DASH family cryptochrome [Haliea sp. SAOS-164]TGD72232.1 DASH family cryptochrome [Haliea sp. SAOS-164]
MTELYWFRNDLRVEDNLGLSAHACASRLLCVYFWPRQVPWCNLTGLGGQRERFLTESLVALQSDLRERGQELLVLQGSPERWLPELVLRYSVERVGVAKTPGVYEAKELRQLGELLDVPLVVHEGNTLFPAAGLPWQMGDIPRQYTPFRQGVEGVAWNAPEDVLRLPPPPGQLEAMSLAGHPTHPHPSFIVRGGTQAGRERLHTWMFRERAVDNYKATRNELEGLFFSSFLSPWLANGSLSVRRVAQSLRDYERTHGANESTRHLYSELLWREFFHWRAYEDGTALFRPHGRQPRRHLRTFEPRNFARWCAGATDYPLVNALMHQLVTTGWMSNRGRQIAASCLVNELNLDWRFGAAFFEKHLLDYDVASNYGNWQYIAGVGADPRGGRHFNIEKQAALYDPDGEFVRRWHGECAPQPEFTVDAADWPIT